MNTAMILSLVRAVMQIAGALGVGILSQTQSDAIITVLPGVLNAIATVWGAFASTKAAIVAKAADIVPIPVHEQVKAGVTKPVVVPSNPPSRFPPTRAPTP